jgi:hypothetical protein
MALALLTGAHVVAAQSGDEAAIEQAVEAFRNAMNYAPWMAMNHRHKSGQEPIVITREVQQKMMEAGLAGCYRDALAINERIDAGWIEVRTGSATGNSCQRTRAGKRGRDDDLNCPSQLALVIHRPRGWHAARATVTNSTQLFSDCRTCSETQRVLQHQLSLLASRAAAFGAYRACFGTPPTHALTA